MNLNEIRNDSQVDEEIKDKICVVWYCKENPLMVVSIKSVVTILFDLKIRANSIKNR